MTNDRRRAGAGARPAAEGNRGTTLSQSSVLSMSDPLLAAMSEQVGAELGASVQYVLLAGYFEGRGLPGLARFFHAQADEEREHAMRFVRFVVDSGAQLRIPAIPEQRADFESAAEAVGLALESEEEVTRRICALVDLAKRDRHAIAERFLDWFVNEQHEEVTSMRALLDVVEHAGEDNLLAVEQHLAREGKVPGGRSAG